MKFILIANYLPDGQESMKRYALALKENLVNRGFQAEIWFPKVIFGSKNKSGLEGLNKWLAYIDKFLIFPVILKFRMWLRSYPKDTFFHVCDHSNSPYLQFLPSNRSGITCHDVIAIRGAFGYKEAHCSASATGKILQKWIFKHLRKATRLAAVSELTLNQLVELCDNKIPENANWKVIYNSFNGNFFPMPLKEREEIMKKINIPEGAQFVLHIGSALPRKNRGMLIDMIQELGETWDGYVCLAGKPIDANLQSRIDKAGLNDRVISVVRPDHDTLVALYSSCFAFIFPSFSEGFGWPVIEAQACGAPVIASNIEPMPEVSGRTALHANPSSPREFAESFLKLLDYDFRSSLVERGFKNCTRFNTDKITEQFLQLYREKKPNE